ncbi:MAG TPA: hypothetical protein VJP80_03850 [Candidatus Saccharimonadales bacterium]|nr:hypothetical protein [Candidatus Saccharimonadales bacterium]
MDHTSNGEKTLLIGRSANLEEPMSGAYNNQGRQLAFEPRSNYENEELFKKTVERLETLDVLTARKVELILAATGDKRAALLEFDTATKTRGDSEPELDDTRSRQLVDIARDLGLYGCVVEEVRDLALESRYELESQPDMPADLHAAHEAIVSEDILQKDRVLFAARDPADLDEVQAANADPDISRGNQRLGAVLGYPTSATQAYLEGRSIPVEKTGTQDLAALAFCRYYVSPENFTAELETARRWARSVQQISPVIYSQFVNEHIS